MSTVFPCPGNAVYEKRDAPFVVSLFSLNSSSFTLCRRCNPMKMDTCFNGRAADVFFGDLRRRSVLTFSTALAIHLFSSKVCCPLLCRYNSNQICRLCLRYCEGFLKTGYPSCDSTRVLPFIYPYSGEAACVPCPSAGRRTATAPEDFRWTS